MAKLDRLLNLTIALLDTAVPLTAEEIRRRVPGYEGDSDEAFHRKFERDKDDLRELGVPVATAEVDHLEQPRAAYTIDPATYQLPDPGLDRDELAALHLAATAVHLEGLDPDEAEDALRKLGGLTAAVDGPTTQLGAVPTPSTAVALFSAVLERREVRFDYQGAGRRVQPHRLQYERGRWYLTAYDLDREDRRTFRVDRIEGGVDSGGPGAFEPPADAGRPSLRPWELGEGDAEPALVLVDRAAAAALLADDPELEVAERRDDGSVVLRLQVRNPRALVDLVLSLLERAELLAPDSARRELVQHLEALAGTAT